MNALIPPEIRQRTLDQSERRWRDVLKPPEDIDPCDWIEQNIILTRTEKQGFLRLDTTPYCREVIRTIRPDDPTERVTLCWGSQLSKTTTELGIAAFSIFNGQQVLFATSTIDHAEKFVNERLDPLIDNCEALKSLLVEDTKLTKRFRHSSLQIIGGMHPRQVKQISAAVIFGDEVDSWGNKGAVFAQLQERGKGYTRPKLYEASTPDLENGPIWTNYSQGTREKYLVKCRNCREPQELVWENLIFSEARNEDGTWNKQKAREVARYKCPFCGFEHHEHDKPKMLLSGQWVAEHPEIKNHRSFHLSSLYSPFYSWGRMAQDFCAAYGQPETLRQWRCGYLAKPWEIYTKADLSNRILEKCGNYDRGTCPRTPVAVVLTADYGDKHIHWLLTAFCGGGTAHVIDFGKVPYLQDLLPIAEGTIDGWPVTHVGIDAQYNTDEVTDFCHDHGFYPIHGSTQIHTATKYNKEEGHWLFHTDMLKDQLEDRIQAPKGKWEVFADDGQLGDFLHQMGSEERLFETNDTGFGRWIWHKRRAANHYWDCAVYSFGFYEAFKFRFFQTMATEQLEKAKPPAESQQPSPQDDHFSCLNKYRLSY